MGVSENKEIDLLKRNLNIINYIRHNESSDISAIADAFNVSWPTMKTNFTWLCEKKLLIESDTKHKKHRINPEYGYMLGISIGATETKVALIDFEFNTVDWTQIPFIHLFNKISEFVNIKQSADGEECILCFETNHNFIDIRTTCSIIIEQVLDFCQTNELNLFSVGIALPGIIDKQSCRMIFCPNIPELLNINVKKIIADDIVGILCLRNISFYISHDATATTVYEKEWTYKQFFLGEISALSKNMAVIYMGSGLASGYIFENRLLLGTTGTGEIGHLDMQYIDLPKYDKETYDYVLAGTKKTQKPVDSDEVVCMCGKKNCLEKLIRTKVFNSLTMHDFLEKIDRQSLASFKTDNPYRYRVLCHFISQLLNITINMLNVDKIILTGRVFNGINELKKDIEGLKIHSSLGCFSDDCEISFGSTRADTVAIGAAILSYYRFLNNSDDELKIEW